MKAEERARSLCDSWDTLDMAEFERAIASAIRSAENEALERAAAAGAGQTLRNIDDGTARGEAAANVADAIRSLKHKDN